MLKNINFCKIYKNPEKYLTVDKLFDKINIDNNIYSIYIEKKCKEQPYFYLWKETGKQKIVYVCLESANYYYNNSSDILAVLEENEVIELNNYLHKNNKLLDIRNIWNNNKNKYKISTNVVINYTLLLCLTTPYLKSLMEDPLISTKTMNGIEEYFLTDATLFGFFNLDGSEMQNIHKYEYQIHIPFNSEYEYFYVYKTSYPQKFVRISFLSNEYFRLKDDIKNTLTDKECIALHNYLKRNNKYADLLSTFKEFKSEYCNYSSVYITPDYTLLIEPEEGVK